MFVIYAHEDKTLRDEFLKHIKVLCDEGLIQVWTDSEISPGAEWDDNIRQQLEQTDIFIALVSPDFYVSPYIQSKELPFADACRQAGKADLIPVLIEACYWGRYRIIRDLQVLPTDNKPVNDWQNRNKAWESVVDSIAKHVENILIQGNIDKKKEAAQAQQGEMSLSATDIYDKVIEDDFQMPDDLLKRLRANLPKFHELLSKVIINHIIEFPDRQILKRFSSLFCKWSQRTQVYIRDKHGVILTDEDSIIRFVDYIHQEIVLGDRYTIFERNRGKRLTSEIDEIVKSAQEHRHEKGQSNPVFSYGPDTSLDSVSTYYLMQTKEEEWRKQGRLLKEVYIDAYDAIRLIQGVWGFWEYDRGRGNRENAYAYTFNKSLFNTPNTLVYSFLFNERIPAPVRLLPPHQEELAQKIREYKGLFGTRGIMDLTNQLWHELGLLDLILESQTQGPLPAGRVIPYLQRLRGHDLYIAHDLLQVPYWYDRYNKIFKEDRTIIWDDTSYDFAAITKSKEFDIILHALDEERSSPTMSHSNFVDAIAFCVLKGRLDAFKKDATHSTRLPTMFMSKSGTIKALKKVMDKHPDMFSYTFGQGGQQWKFPVIREAQYFVFDTIFNYESQEKKEKALHHLFLELREAFDHEMADHALLNKILGKSNTSKLEDSVSTLINDIFFDKIWAKHEGYQQMYQTIRAHDESLHIAEREQEYHEQERQKIISELRRDTRNFELANYIMSQLFRLNDPNDKLLNQIAHIDVFSDLSMVRFSFTKLMRDEIQRYARGLLKARGADDFKYEARALLSDIMDGLENFRKDKSDNSTTRLTVGLAVLWVFSKYDLIVRIAERLNTDAREHEDIDFPNYQIPLLFASALCRMEGQESVQRAQYLARYIEERFSNSSNFNYKVWLGLAYVWWSIGNKHLNWGLEMPEEMGKSVFQENRCSQAFDFIGRAQHLSTQVITFLHRRTREDATENNASKEFEDKFQQRIQKYYYSINLNLFLTILYGTKQEILSIQTENLFKELNSIEGSPLWHSRYYDTCARYHYRRALLSENLNTFNALLDVAAMDNERRRRTTLIVEGFDYGRQLENAINLKRADGYKGWKEKNRLIN